MLKNREWDIIRTLAILDDASRPFIGDDCALLTSPRMLVTTDHMVEGVHFDFSFMPPEAVGWRLMAANASDILAMGGKPTHCTLNLAFPPDRIVEADGIIAGIIRFCRQYRIVCIGGDTTGASSFFVGATMFAPAPEHPWQRRGARPGDRLLIAAEPGLSQAGLCALRRGYSDCPTAHQRFLYPDPFAYPVPTGEVHAAIDLSDSLFSETTLLANASGVSIEINLDAIPCHHEVALVAAREKLLVSDLLLAGGEEFFLIVTAPTPMPGWHEIGIVTERGSHEVIVRSGGVPLDTARLPVWNHFSR